MNPLVVGFVLCALVPAVHSASASINWCYHEASCSDSQWATIAPEFCNGTRQSPIDIVSADATVDSTLTAFSFVNYDSTSSLDKVMNTGKTIKVTLKSGLEVSGGDFSVPYNSLQFHLHWGNGSAMPGSEHTVNGKRYPMELHIVNIKSTHNGNVSVALADSTGFAALGFFIEEMSGNDTNSPASWGALSALLASIKYKDQEATVPAGLSMDDLLAGVDRTQYYRYLGSLTTPACFEAVLWTVFKEPIKVSKDLIDLFSTTVFIGDNTSTTLMTNVYRGIQPAQPVRTTATVVTATTAATTASSSASAAAYSLGLIVLNLLLKGGSV